MKYKVGGGVSASTYIGEFEATTPEEAIEKAYKAAYVSVCHQCARSIQDPEVTDLWAEDESGNVTSEPSNHDKLVTAQAEIGALRNVLDAAMKLIIAADRLSVNSFSRLNSVSFYDASKIMIDNREYIIARGIFDQTKKSVTNLVTSW